MKTLHKTTRLWKVIPFLPLASLLFLTFSCTEEITDDLNAMQETLGQVEMPQKVQRQYQILKDKNPGVEFTYVEMSKSKENFERIRRFRTVDDKTIVAIYPFNDRGVIGIILSNTENFERAVTSSVAKDGVFTITEDPAMPIGGYAAFFEHIKSTLQYPQEAREQEVHGKVFVEFVVNEQGYLTNALTKKGIGFGCDEEAVRAVIASPKWEPAKQEGVVVKQRIVLPITFSLSNGENQGTMVSEQ